RPLVRDSPSIQGDVPGPDPARAPPNKAIARAGLACRGQPAGGSLASARSAARSAPAPPGGACLVHVGPHAIGTERFLAVASGTSLAQVAAAILRTQAPVQNPDKDEAAGSSPAWPTNRLVTSGNAGCQ